MSTKKILIIVENASVPRDPRVWHEACSLRDAGYQVTVLCPRSKEFTSGREVIDGILIYRHPGRSEGKSPLGLIAEYCMALFWQALYSIWIYLRHGFEVIQGCNPPDTIVFIALPFKLAGVKYIFDHHDVVPELYYAKYRRKDVFYAAQLWLEKITFRFSDVVMATNESYRAVAVARGGMDPRDVFVVRNGPDVEMFQPVAPNPALKHGKRHLVGYVGEMGVQDGLDMLLDVVLYLKERGREDVHFTCVGRGSELERLRRRVKDSGIDDMVDFPGWISKERLLEVLSTADVCVNPDTPSEMNNISTMIKILEYMALSKPIVQCDFREGKVSAMEASLYADTRNAVPDFGEKIAWLLENPDERRRMGEFGRRRIEEALAWKYSVPQLLGAYNRAFAKKERVPVVARSLLEGAEREEGGQSGMGVTRDLFYRLKPLIPRWMQIRVRRRMASWLYQRNRDGWPILEGAGARPPSWPGWPGGKRFALVLTHDVELPAGVSRCEELAGLEEERGFRSAFGFVPLRYRTPEQLRTSLVSRGFEVLVHDLYHDGKLYRDWPTFAERSEQINGFLPDWRTTGFSSGAMHHNLPWISQLNIEYSTSTYDVDPFEPQACGLGRIFPFWVQSPGVEGCGFVEMPYTMPQDFTLFALLKEPTNEIWKQKLDWIAAKGGMALIKTHPDYMRFPGDGRRIDSYPVELYTDLLDYIRSRYEGEFWLAQPSEIARYWRSLRPAGTGADPIAEPSTLCASCKRAHAEGWLTNYPRDSAAPGRPT